MDNSDENTPLLHNDTALSSGGSGAAGSGSGDEGREEVYGQVEQPPPAYSSVTGAAPVIACRVCQASIDVCGKREQHVVKCPTCQEATPIRPAPQGRKYVRCTCNCLLICKSISQKVSCPRPNCKKVIRLKMANPMPVPSVTGMWSVSCAHCHDTFLFNALQGYFARCPHCRKVSSVGNNFSFTVGAICLVVFLVLFCISMGVTIGTWPEASFNSGMYALYAILFLLAAVSLIGSIYFFKMKVSFIDRLV